MRIVTDLGCMELVVVVCCRNAADFLCTHHILHTMGAPNIFSLSQASCIYQNIFLCQNQTIAWFISLKHSGDHQQHNVTKISLLVSLPKQPYRAQTKYGCVFSVSAHVCFCIKQLEKGKARICKILHILVTAFPHRENRYNCVTSWDKSLSAQGQRRCVSPLSFAPFGWLVSPCGFTTCVKPMWDVEKKGQLTSCPPGSIHYVGGGQPYVADIDCLWMEEVGLRYP